MSRANWNFLIEFFYDVFAWATAFARWMAEPAVADSVLNAEDKVVTRAGRDAGGELRRVRIRESECTAISEAHDESRMTRSH